jgi:hypothetical protein
MAHDWKCPFCGRDTTVTDNDSSAHIHQMEVENSAGPRVLFTSFTVCPNPKCKKYSLSAILFEGTYKPTPQGRKLISAGRLQEWRLIPVSDAIVFPDYVPASIRTDYAEACAIKKLSPKASATLSRRCLQGMIRDFWGISKVRLIDEIDAIKDKVDPLTWEAIDAVRRVGNIGAHMEKDINVIIDVDPEEAGQLIGLIELLMKDWYVTRFERQERLKSLTAMAQAKKVAAQSKTP